ncbi:MAG TPA: patatin family protein [Acidobacteria bacterium]|nr:patatin family protein [Acidobacteriota bacterium]
MIRGESSGTRPAIGLAMAGGGPQGAIHEIGAVMALHDAIEGLDVNDLEIYVGVSAGAFIAACLANKLTPAQMVRAIVKTEPGEHPFVPETFLTPALGEYVKSGFRVPKVFLESMWSYLRGRDDMTLVESLTRLARALPVGLFKNEPLRLYLERIYSIKGRTDDFRELDSQLIVIATDLDSGQAVRFGEPGFNHVPISKAVQASTALPGLYPPVVIDDRFYVDGVLLKTLHASVAFDEGAELVICLNPIVPVDTIRAVDLGIMRRGKLVDRGLPTVLSQTFRTLIHSRLVIGMEAYEERYADSDFILLEPRRDDYELFFTNVFSFNHRKRVCEHAYTCTLKQLRQRRRELEPILDRHGLALRHEVLEEEDRSVWESAGLTTDPRPTPPPVVDRLDQALGQLERLLEEA